jgi:hypothetical protein
MINLDVREKSGFRSTMPFQIFDRWNNLFYSSDFTNNIKNGKAQLFNLPVGRYSYNGNLIRLASPIKQKEIILPPPERHYQKSKYKIVFKENINKCSIFYDEGLIIFDPSFKKLPLYVLYFVYFHEIGHHLYSTESKADLFAVKEMLESGFNMSQIGKAPLLSLSEKSFNRKENIINSLNS